MPWPDEASSVSDSAVQREAGRDVAEPVETTLGPGGSRLFDGGLVAEIHTSVGEVLRVSQRFPLGSPARPPTADQLWSRLADCVRGLNTDLASWTWRSAPAALRRFLPTASANLSGP